MSNSLFSHKAKQDITLNMSNILKYTQHLQIKDTTTAASIYQTLTKSFAPTPLARTTNYPTEDDLFWCFYIMHFCLQKYTLIRNFFTILKQHKWKRNQLENDLVHEKKISLTTFICLCTVFNYSFIIIDGRKLYDRRTHSNLDDTHLIMKVDEEWSIYTEDDKENKIQQSLETLWIIENIKKPLRAISAYKVKDLKEICKKLQLNYEKKKKRELYQLITEKL